MLGGFRPENEDRHQTGFGYIPRILLLRWVDIISTAAILYALYNIKKPDDLKTKRHMQYDCAITTSVSFCYIVHVFMMYRIAHIYHKYSVYGTSIYLVLIYRFSNVDVR